MPSTFFHQKNALFSADMLYLLTWKPMCIAYGLQYIKVIWIPYPVDVETSYFK